MADQDPVLQSVAEDIKNISRELGRAKTLVQVLKDAGEDVAKMEADIRNLEIRKKKWERVLSARGISTSISEGG